MVLIKPTNKSDRDIAYSYSARLISEKIFSGHPISNII